MVLLYPPPLTSLRPLPRLAPPQKVIVDGIAFSAAAPASILAFFVTPWNSHGPAGQARSSLLAPPRHTCHPRSSPPLLAASHLSCLVPRAASSRGPQAGTAPRGRPCSASTRGGTPRPSPRRCSEAPAGVASTLGDVEVWKGPKEG